MIIFFEGIEIAFVSANRLTIELKEETRHQSGIILSRFLEFPSRFMGSTLVGFNIFLVVFGLLVGETLSPLWEFLIKKTSIPQAWVDLFPSPCLKPLCQRFSSCSSANFCPKHFFRARSDSLLNFFASITHFFYNIFYPSFHFLPLLLNGY